VDEPGEGWLESASTEGESWLHANPVAGFDEVS